MKNVDLKKLPDYLKRQRWFGGKAWPIKSVTLVDHVDLPDRDSVLAVIEVLYELGTPERYLLAITPQADGDIAEAMQDDRLPIALFELLKNGTSLPAGAGALRGEREKGSEAIFSSLPQKPKIRHLTVEQSNTSVVIGEKIILKVIRRLEAGLNPEYEIGHFLASRTSFTATPRFLGAIHLEGQAATTLGLMHEYIPGAVDGWNHVLAALRVSERATPALLEEVGVLGEQVAQLHQALASGEGDPAFAPDPIQLEDLQRWSASIVGEIGVTLAAAQGSFPKLFDHRDAVVARARRIARLSPSGKKIRIHGDLHLGQTLRIRSGWLIFDFEGEPARNFTLRREKHSPLKDVAGMLRSFNYAAATIEIEGAPKEDRATALRKAFLDGYFKGGDPKGLLPKRQEDLDGLLDGLELEKLLYETRYELNNRPDWARIPIEALMSEGKPR